MRTIDRSPKRPTASTARRPSGAGATPPPKPRTSSSRSEIRFIPYETVYGKEFEDMEFRTPDITKLAQVTGYRPTVDLDGILERVIAHFRDELGCAVVTDARPMGVVN